MKLTDWPADERPREKLLHHGAGMLSDAELLAIFLRTGISGSNAVDLSRQLLSSFGSLRNLLAADKASFCQHRGLGEAKFAQLQAVLEMARRFQSEQLRREPALTDVAVTRQFLISQLRDEPNEVFAMLLLDSQHRVIRFDNVFRYD